MQEDELKSRHYSSVLRLRLQHLWCTISVVNLFGALKMPTITTSRPLILVLAALQVDDIPPGQKWFPHQRGCMVFVFFSVSGVLGAIDRHPAITTRENEPAATRSLESDARLFAQTIEPFPGALVVIANDWPLLYDLKFLKQECTPFGPRIVNSVRILGGTKEDAIQKFMSSRSAEYIVVASTDFEFSDETGGRRVNVGLQAGFDKRTADRLRTLLEEYGDAARSPASPDDVMKATSGNPWMQRVQSYLAHGRQQNFRMFNADTEMLRIPGAGSDR